MSRSKPDPECMSLISAKLGTKRRNCAVIEDAASLGMPSIGIGDKTLLFRADYAVPSTKYLSLKLVQFLF